MKKFGLQLTGCWKCYFSIFAFFIFPYFKWLLPKTILFYKGFRGFLLSSIASQIFWSTYFWQWNDGPFKIFWNFTGNAFCFFIFSKWKKYWNLTFDDTFKMCLCALCQSKFKLHKWALFTDRWICYFFFMFILTRLLSKTLWKNYQFLIQISKIHYKM